jgi:hypothetical protein
MGNGSKAEISNDETGVMLTLQGEYAVDGKS